MSKNMQIKVSVSDNDFLYHQGQKVNFINILDHAQDFTTPPTEISYKIENEIDYTALLNYEDYTEESGSRKYLPSQGFAPIYKTEYSFVDLFRREVKTIIGDKTIYARLTDIEREKIESLDQARGLYFRTIGGWMYIPISDYKEELYGKFTKYYPVLYRMSIQKDQTIVESPLTTLELVSSNIDTFTFKDFNITNGRTYQYILYPVAGGDRVVREEVIVKTNWSAWSITELHPVNKSKTRFTANNDDVWLFNLNLESGTQTQNLSRNEQQTLGQYPRYSQSRKNYISGDISCLLGSQVIPASYVEEKGVLVQKGGYVEKRAFDLHPTSNEKIDMLKAWRKIAYSGNPKLLKDVAGQSFLIAITQNSNKPYDHVMNQPNTINFSWTQIGSTDNITVLDV